MATNTVNSFTDLTGNGTAGPFNVSFSYLSEAEVDVTVGGVAKTLGTHYTFTSATQITFTSGNEPGNGVAIKFQRNTNISSKAVDFNDGSVLTEIDLDNQSDQILFSMQEIMDSGVGILATTSAPGSMSASDKTKLDSIETNADVTDATNVDNSGAVMNSDLDGKGELLVGDGSGDPTALPSGTNGYILKVNTSTATGLEWVSTNTISVPLTSLSASNLLSGTIPDGRFPATLPAISGTNLTNLNASNLSSGTVPDARFPATLPTASGVNLTALNGSNIASGTIAAARVATLNQNTTGTSGGFTAGDASNLNAGTIPDARFPATLPAASAANLTSIPAANITGTLPALDGSALTGVGVTVQEEGSSLSTAGTTFNFVGAGVTASGTGATKTITVPGGGLSNIVSDTTPQLGGNLDVQGSEINTSTTNGNIVLNPNGTGVVEVKGDGTTSGTVGTLQLNCSNNNHGVKIASPPHSAGASYTLTLPNTDGNADQVLKTDGSGGLDWVDQPTGNATHTGEVTGSTALTIADNVVDEANLKVSNTPTNGYVLTAQSGNTGGLTWAAQSTGATDKISEGNTEAETVDTGSDGHFKVTTEGTERLRVIADGKVGIGTSTPGELLQIYDASGNPTIHVRANNQNTASLKFENDDGNWTISSGTSNYPLKFAVGGSDKFTILNDGKVGIGTTSPSTVLEVNGSFKAGATTFTASTTFEDAINETIFAITDASSVALDPDNGMIQTWTLGANRTATDSLTTGQSMLLIVTASGSNYTMTWPTMKWSGGSAPTLGGANPTAIELFKVGSQLYGATVGDLS